MVTVTATAAAMAYSWTPDGSHLITASRDGLCKVWSIGTAAEALQLACSFSPFDGAAVTAVQTIAVASKNSSVLAAVGSENGQLKFWKIPNDSSVGGSGGGSDAATAVTTALKEPMCALTVPDNFAHGSTVKRIRCLPEQWRGGALLASVSADHTLRLHQLHL